MSAHRFFAVGPLDPDSGGRPLPLSAQDLHHAGSVLRLQPGETIELVTDTGRLLEFRIASIAVDGVVGELVRELPVPVLPHVALMQGVAKGEKMELIVRQSVEVGVAQIVPVLTSRSVVRIPSDKRLSKAERWRRIARSAAEQSHRSSVPDVEDVVDLAEVPELLGQFDATFVLWEDATSLGLVEAVTNSDIGTDGRVAVFVGPEGGLSKDEVDALTQAGAIAVTLGPTILRTETAAVVAVALALHARGGLGASG